MKRLALVAALLAMGCETMANHPSATIATVVVADVGAGVCAFECDHPGDYLADGALVVEAAVIAAGVLIVYAIADSAGRR